MNTKLLVIGSGSLGQRHLANLRFIAPDAQLALCPTRPGRPAHPVASDVDALWLNDLDAALGWAPTAAVIATPSPTHLSVAARFVDQGIPVLIEKPIAARSEGVASLLQRARARDVVVLVGYCLRYSPSLRAMRDAVMSGRIGRILGAHAEVGQDLAGWRTSVELHESVTASATHGGGALLELSHEIDYLRWILGPPTLRAAAVANLGVHDLGVDETADLLLDMGEGVTATVHLDLVRRPAVRRCSVWGTSGTVAWDGVARTAVLHDAGTGAPSDLCSGIEDANEMYIAELRHFLHCVDGKEEPLVTGEDALEVLNLCEAARQWSPTSNHGDRGAG